MTTSQSLSTATALSLLTPVRAMTNSLLHNVWTVVTENVASWDIMPQNPQLEGTSTC